MPRPKILDVNEGVGEALFYPYNVKINKCSGSCNTLDNPIEKLCVPNVIKGLNMNVYNFLTMLNKTRNVLWHESCKCLQKISIAKNFAIKSLQKISIETKNNANNNIKIHNIRYKNGGYYLTINNLRGYFNFNSNLGTLTMLFDNINQQNKYYQVWKNIFKIINRGHGELKLHEKIRLYHNDLPIKQVFKIHSLTVVIQSLIEKNNKFYLELSLNHCLYKL